MAKTIWKYTLEMQDEQALLIPEGAVVRMVGMQYGKVNVWVEVGIPERVGAPRVPTVFYIRGTGHPLPEDGEYLGSVVDGQFVWHILRRRQA